MPVNDSAPLVRKHIMLFADDWERLEQIFGRTVGASRAIRTMLNGYLDDLEAAQNAKRSASSTDPATTALAGKLVVRNLAVGHDPDLASPEHSTRDS